MTDQVNTTSVKESNPRLHALYVRWAISHLIIIDKAIKMLKIGNIDLMDCYIALQRERDKLIAENDAYRDAQDILDDISKL